MYADAAKEHKRITKDTILDIFVNNYGLTKYIPFNRGESDF